MPRRRKRRPLSGNGRGSECAYCKRTLQSTEAHGPLAATRDHVHPKSEGGRFRVWCCKLCNHLKRNMRIDEWRRFMAENPEWWKGRTVNG